MPRPAVIVMAKAPRAGEAKTRLAPPLTRGEAARLAACLFADTLSLALDLGAVVVVAHAPADGRAALEEALRAASLEEAAREVIRVSFGPRTSENEIESFLAEWRKLYARRRAA